MDKISKEVMEIGTKNGLKPKDIRFTDKLIKNNFNASKTYKETINNKTTDLTARVQGSKKITNANIQKTIQEVLTDNKITKDSTIKRHNLIIDKAIDIKQLSTAEKGNSRFMEMLGMLEVKKETNNTVNILNLNIDNEEASVIKERLLGLGQKTGK